MPAASVSAVATVGGGARIPLITQRLSEHLRAPVVTTNRTHSSPRPRVRRCIAHRSRVVDAATTLTPTARGCRRLHRCAGGPRQQLAWSEDDASEDVLPYSDVTDSRPEVQFRHEEWQDAAAAAAWPARAVRSVGDRRRHRRGGPRHHAAQRQHHDPGRSGDHLDHLPRACGAGHSPSYPRRRRPPKSRRLSCSNPRSGRIKRRSNRGRRCRSRISRRHR